MEEFNETIFEEKEKPVFKSELGDFNYYQDKLLRFGRSNKMKTFMLIHVAVYVLSLLFVIYVVSMDMHWGISGNDTYNFGYVKVIVVASNIIALAYLIGILMIYFGSKKLKVYTVASGVNIALNYLRFLRLILYLSGGLLAALLLIILFKEFFLAIISAVIFGGIFYLYYCLLNESIMFLESVEANLRKTKKYLPDASVINIYLGIMLVLAGIGFLVDIFSSANAYSVLSLSGNFREIIKQLQQLKLFEAVTTVLRMLSLGYTIYLIKQFNLNSFPPMHPEDV